MLPRVRWLHGRRADLGWGATTAAAALLVAFWALDAWGNVRTDVPAYYAGSVPSRFAFDLNAHGIFLQSLLETGSYQHHERLGAPFGLDLYDFPLGTENLQWLALRVLSIAADTTGALMNTYLLLTFPLVAVAAFAGFRVLRVSRPASFGLGVLFALLPYHFLRGEYHLLLSNYASVPIGAVLVVLVLRGDVLFPRGPRRRLGTHRLTGRALLVLAACVLLGSLSFYYTALTLLLLALAAPIAALRHRGWAPLATAAVLCAAIGVTTLVNTAPSLRYWGENGRNELTAARAPSEAELYSLKLTQLVLPSRYHRVDALADLGSRYTSSELLSDEATVTLGIAGTLGLAWILAFSVAAVAGRSPRLPRLEEHRAAALGALLAFAVGTTGGLSALISWYVTPQLRAYNRVSLFIAFFALLSLGLLLDALAGRLRDRGWSRPAIAVGAALLLLIGVLDQTSGKLTPDYAKARAAWRADADFGRAAEGALGPRAEVFQFPVVPFPEFPPVNGMLDYDHARGVLHTRTLRWSYGAMKGRPAAEWQQKLIPMPAPQLVRSVAAAGFAGLYIDRAGLVPATAAPYEADVARTVRAAPIVVSADQRIVLYDLRPYAERLRRRLGAPAFSALGRETLRAPPAPG